MGIARGKCEGSRSGNPARWAGIVRTTRTAGCCFALLALLLCASVLELRGATVPTGFTETIIPGPSSGSWNEAVGITFDSTGRMYVWERAGRIWFKDPSETTFTLLLDISEEVGAWGDHGFLGFALDPEFRGNGYIYLLYIVDRYYLMNYGTPGYNPASNDYNSATIGRLTRYTCRSSDSFRSVDPASRRILIGETAQTGIAECSDTHGVGTLLFGEDGTLLVGCGDGASPSTNDTGGPVYASNAAQALADGIIKPKEDVGAFRSQLVDCLNGKILRIDPATGNGVPSNPFYDPANPRSGRSRVWALGMRNPFRMALRPGTGSQFPADGRPGVLYVGDVGWETWESLKIVTGPGMNFGWPIYEGLAVQSQYNEDVPNQDAPNPLYPASGCNQYFSFRELLHEDTLNTAAFPPFVNPCNSTARIPSSIPQFLHSRPVFDWNHLSAITRTPIFDASGNAATANLGAANSPVSGTEFAGNCSVGGAWYTGSNFPAAYRNCYYHADWQTGWIKKITLDTNDKPQAVEDFLTGAGSVVCVVQNPIEDALYYVTYTYGDAGTVRKLDYTGNRTPVAVASAQPNYGPSPLSVQFSSTGSSDPDGGPLTYSWDFGDGSAIGTQPAPLHTFSVVSGSAKAFQVKLTVTDSGGLSAQSTLGVVLNDTPPNVSITSPSAGTKYSITAPTNLNLVANVTDRETADSQLSYQWQTLLHHNAHNHILLSDTNHVSSTTLSPIGCDGLNIYYYTIVLTVTDPVGLATVSEVNLFPDCGSPDTPPTLSAIANQTVYQEHSTGPIPFAVSDLEVAAQNLQLSAQSSNQDLVPVSNIVFAGSGTSRNVSIMPAIGQTGTSSITVTVNDGPNNVSDTFLLTVVPAPTGTVSVTNSTGITIPDSGAGSPYPSYINVTGVSGTVTNLSVQLNNFSHSWANDVDILLVGPGGQSALLLSDAGTGPTTNAMFLFSDSASAPLPQTGALSSGTYKPTNYETASDGFAAPAPIGPYATALSVFAGQPAAGTWALYVFDDGPGDQGSIAGGWGLTLTTATSGSTSQPPTITSIGAQSTTVNTAVGPIGFTIGDPDTPVSSLVLSGSSSNITLVPNSNIAFGGTGSARSVTVTPAPQQTGTASITVNVSDGTQSASSTFLLTVSSTNTAPVISSIPNQTTAAGTAVGPIPFTVGDAETPAGNLSVTGTSSNTALVPAANITLSGTGGNRNVSVLPAPGLTGTATITLTVSDGALSANSAFLLTVTSGTGGTSTFSNSASISIPDQGAGSPYPSNIGVTGLSGTISNVVVRLNGFSHTWPDDVDVLLVGPQGQTALVLSDAGTGSTSGATFTFTDSAANRVPQTGTLLSGTYKPTNYGTTVDTFASPATVGPYGATLSAFNGQSPNGTWSLYVMDDGPGDQGTISGGWSLTLTTGTSGAQPPTISAIPNQSIAINSSTPPIGFSINDPDTPPTSLTVSGSSSNQPLVPTGNIVFGGTGTNRTVTITPAAQQTGTATITVTVSDGSLTASSAFQLAVSAANTPPTISSIANQTTTSGTGVGPIPFTVGDQETPAASLTLTGTSSNATLVPSSNILFGGTGANRTVTVTPVAQQTGTATITVTVSDGALTANSAFQLTVSGSNTPPTISSIPNQTTTVGTPVGPIPFTVGDQETPPANLILTGSSSSATLVPVGNIVFGGTGTARTVTVTPAAAQTGTATIGVRVSDGALTASTAFTLVVNPATSGSGTFSNSALITIPDSGAASLYPSSINVVGLSGTIKGVTVRLVGLSHTWSNDIDVLLVSPGGQKLLLLSDAGNGAVSNATFTFSQAASSVLSQWGTLVSGTYLPTNYDTTTDTFAAPAPGPTYANTLSVFNGQTPNGTWSLYIMDDGPGDQGQVSGGWSITIISGP